MSTRLVPIPIRTSECGMQSVTRLLIHQRNTHGAGRAWTRTTIHLNLALLRGLRHG
jgi:hypothetical protein